MGQPAKETGPDESASDVKSQFVRLVSRERQAPLPQTASPSKRAEHDVEFLFRHLSSFGTIYKHLQSTCVPDEEGHSLSVYAEQSSARRIVVERMEVTSLDFRRTHARHGAHGMEVGRGWFMEAVMSKIKENQIRALKGFERVLLIRSRVQGAAEGTYIGAQVKLSEPPTDHAYLIARGRLLQCW